MRGYFITGTGTGIGKTTFTCALSRALLRLGKRVISLKPIETGVHQQPLDALHLAEACGHPPLAVDPRWYRARAPLSPYAAHLEGEPLPHPPTIIDAVRQHGANDETLVLVEGAGGLLVPLTRDTTIADFALALALPLLLVAPDRLGVLSDVLTTHEAAVQRGLAIDAVVLHRMPQDRNDPSQRTNARVLEERLALPVLHSPDINDATLRKLGLPK